MTEGELKKRLIADASKLHKEMEKLAEERDQICLETTDNERKHLEKARKWS